MLIITTTIITTTILLLLLIIIITGHKRGPGAHCQETGVGPRQRHGGGGRRAEHLQVSGRDGAQIIYNDITQHMYVYIYIYI